MDRRRVAIVIPALNEAATIGRIIEAASPYGIVVVVDDCSTDATSSIATSGGADVVVHPTNRGYDAALNSGFQRAAELGCEVIISLDADGQHDPALLSRFIAAIDAGADVVVGVRSERQRLAEGLFAFYTRLFYKIRDPLCGLKAYRTEVYRRLGRFDSYGSVGTELMLFAAKRGERKYQEHFLLPKELE